MSTRIKLRRDTSENWTANNPTLGQGELGLVTNAASANVKLKIGDGSTAWNSLTYFVPDSGSVAWGSITGTLLSQVDLQIALNTVATTATWGGISGTLSNQVDLQNALTAKVAGPSSSTDNEIPIYNSTTGKIVKNSNVIITVIGSDNRIGIGKTITIDDADGIAGGYNVRSRKAAVSYGYNIDNPNTTNTFNSVNFGKDIANRTTRGICFGADIDITAGLASITAVGDNITIGADFNRMVVVGHDITLSRDFTGNGDGVAIGNNAYVGGWKAVTIGYAARCEGTAQMAIGWTAGCYDNAGHTMAIGRGTGAFTDNAIVLGSYSNLDLWLGNGDCHIFNNTGNGGDEETFSSGTNDQRIATYHGPDAWDKRDTPLDSSIPGGQTRIVGGAATGNANTGKVYLSVYQKRSSATGFENTKTSTVLNNVIVDQDQVTILEGMIWRNASPGIAYFSHKDFANSSDYAIRQQSSGAVDVNAPSGQNLILKINNATRLTIGSSNVTAAVPMVVPTFTVTTLPNASTNARGLIYVSNETGGAVIAFSDGTNWRRVTDRAIVS